MIVLRCTNEAGVKTDLDIIQDSGILLDISAIESGEIGTVFGVSSQGFALPPTNNNQAFFGYLDNLGSTPATGFIKTIPCQVLNDGNEVFDGKLYVQDVITDQNGDTIYNVVVVNETIDFSIAIQNLTVQDLDWSNYNHSYSYANISASWSDNLFGGDIVYPLIDFGQIPGDPLATEISAGGNARQFDNANFPLQVTDFQPSIRAKAVVDTIFDAVGYTYTSSFFNTDYFNNLYIVSTQDDKKGTTFVNPTTQSFQALRTSSANFSDYTLHTIGFTNEVFDNSNNYNPATSTFTAQEDGVYTVYSLVRFQEGIIDPASPRVLFIYVYVNGAEAGNTFINLTNLAPGIERQAYIGPIGLNLTAGDDVNIRFYYEPDTTNSISIRTNSRFEMVGPSSLINGTVTMQNIFDPKTKVVDILKGLIEKFNLVIEPTVNSRNTLSIQTFNDWIDQGTTVNWTDIVDRDTKFKIEHPLQTQPKQIYFSDEEDTDVLNTYTKEQFGVTFGDYTYTSDSDLAEGERKIGTYFASTPIAGINGALLMVIPKLFKKQANQEGQPFKYKPRLLYKVGMQDTPLELKGKDLSGNFSGSYFFISDGSTVYAQNQYMLFHHNDALPATFGSTRDLNFGNLNHWEYHQPEYNAFTSRTAFQEYWAFYINELYDIDARLLTCNIMLDPVVIPTIKLNQKIFIDGHYYRINKISSANLVERASVQVQLLKSSPRKLPYPRRRIINRYTGDLIQDVVVKDVFQNGTVVYADFETGESADVLPESVLASAPKDGFLAYNGGSNPIWNNNRDTGASFVTQEQLGTNLIDRAADKVKISGDFNEVKSGVQNSVVNGVSNTVLENVTYATVEGTSHFVDRQNTRVQVLGGNQVIITGSNEADMGFLNANNVQVSGSSFVTVVGGRGANNFIENADGTTMINPYAVNVIGPVDNDITVVGGSNKVIYGGNYNTVINPSNDTTGSLYLNDYRFKTTVIGGTYLDNDLYLNRNSLNLELTSGSVYYAYSGDALYKYVYNIDWTGSAGIATIELPTIDSQTQYGRSILFKASSNITSSKEVYIESFGNIDTIEGGNRFILDTPNQFVELRAGEFPVNDGLVRGWQVIRSSTSVGTTIVSGSNNYLTSATFSNPNLSLTSTGLGFSGLVNLSTLVPNTASFAISSSRAVSSSLATNASNIGITDNPTYGGVTYYPVFVGQTTGFTNALVDSSVFTYNPATNILNTTSSYAITASYALNAGGATGGISYDYDTTTLNVNNQSTIFGNALQGLPVTSIINTGSLTAIGASVFNNLSGSYNFVNVKIIGPTAFDGCIQLNSITANSCSLFNTSSFSTSTATFRNCTNLTTASFTNLENIPNLAFSACTNISSSGYNFGNFTGSIGTQAFSNNEKIVNTNFVSGAISLNINVFGNCDTLVSASFVNAISVGGTCFASSPLLSYVNLPALSGSIALGGSTGNNSVFNNTALSGSITVPSFYSSSNAGAPDGDIAYLIGRSWTVNYI